MQQQISDLEAEIHGLSQEFTTRIKDKIASRKQSENENIGLHQENEELRTENDKLWDQVNDLKQRLKDERGRASHLMSTVQSQIGAVHKDTYKLREDMSVWNR